MATANSFALAEGNGIARPDGVIGYAAASATSLLASSQIKRRNPTDHDVQIEILFCGICHSDLHSVRNEWSEFMPTVDRLLPDGRSQLFLSLRVRLKRKSTSRSSSLLLCVTWSEGQGAIATSIAKTRARFVELSGAIRLCKSSFLIVPKTAAT
jgi:hypothetical protein